MSELNSENIYFTNDLDDLDFIKNCLTENSIPHEIIFNNNSHPIFGTNMALGMDSILYKYAVRVPVEYVEKAQNLLNEVLNSDQAEGEETPASITDEEEVLSSRASVQEKAGKIIPIGLLAILLVILHFSRYFSMVKIRGDGKVKTGLLYLIGILWMISYFVGLSLAFVGPNVYDFDLGFITNPKNGEVKALSVRVP
ncbi:MAG: hypothetical protein II032_03060 [Treponema sp.]|nr:hypothetical protein [Treponema sp.]